MAVLRGKVSGVEMTIRPYRLTEEGRPSWLSTYLELKESGRTLLSTTVSMTKDDLAELRAQLARLAAEERPAPFALATTDGDLVLEGCHGDMPGEVFVGVWRGQPYEVMRGFRFLARGSDLPQFVCDLLSDESTALPTGRLP